MRRIAGFHLLLRVKPVTGFGEGWQLPPITFAIVLPGGGLSSSVVWGRSQP